MVWTARNETKKEGRGHVVDSQLRSTCPDAENEMLDSSGILKCVVRNQGSTQIVAMRFSIPPQDSHPYRCSSIAKAQHGDRQVAAVPSGGMRLSLAVSVACAISAHAGISVLSARV